MANTIKLRRSATQDAVPTTSQLALGELAMNTYDGKLFMKTDQGGTEAVIEIGAGSISISSTTPAVGDSEAGDIYWDSDEGNAYILYDDGNGTAQWVPLTATASGAVADSVIEGNTSAEVVDTGTDGHFKVTTEGSERLRVDADGRLLVGTTADNSNGNTDAIAQFESSGGPEVLLTRNQNVIIDSDHIGELRWSVTDGNEPQTDCARIRAVAAGNHAASNHPTQLEFHTGGLGEACTDRLKILRDGTLQLHNSPGIDFSNIQTNGSGMFSETLDSYEEGTFTPSLTSTSPGTLSFSVHTNNGGTYVKIGRTVFVSINLRGTLTTGTATGSARLTGLPFTVANNNVANSIAGASGYSAAAVPFAKGIDQPSGYFTSGGFFLPNSTEVIFYEQSETAELEVNISRFGSDVNIHLSGTYLVATA